jgi:hypothetical protein
MHRKVIIKAMSKTISILPFIFLLPFVSKGQVSTIDSLISVCKSKIDYLCKSQITSNKSFDGNLVLNDQAFFKKIGESFTKGAKLNKVKKLFKGIKFVSRRKIYSIDNKKILEILFYSNYTKGSIIYQFEEKRLVKMGCRVENDFTLYCGKSDTSNYNILYTIDIPFYKEHIIPYFLKFNIKEACRSLIVEDILDLQALLK